MLDGIERRTGKPDCQFKPTNIKNSQYVVSLHTDSKSGIPHLHIVANRIDNNGNTNDAHYIGERAVHAANIINEKRGWVQSVQRRSENIQQISEDCIDILKAMLKFDWTTYCQMLNGKGYDIKLTKDDKGVVKGYAIRKGNSIYKSSILGKSRKLMPSKIKATWAGLHDSDKQIPIQSKEADVQTRNKEVVTQSNPLIHHYSITVDGEQFKVDIPDMVKSVFDEEFGSLDEEVKQTDVLKVAVLLFAGYLDAATSMSASSGGGGSPGDGWGKDKDDDERNWAVRCARMSKWLCKPIKRSRGR
ncbi:MAG: relaxase/mobilization nuclease domain-containing protein [Paludibacter sp.]|nr:relaxase/mobilization nuclease domain-containing protein [Paludibacter sp.]